MALHTLESFLKYIFNFKSSDKFKSINFYAQLYLLNNLQKLILKEFLSQLPFWIFCLIILLFFHQFSNYVY